MPPRNKPAPAPVAAVEEAPVLPGESDPLPPEIAVEESLAAPVSDAVEFMPTLVDGEPPAVEEPVEAADPVVADDPVVVEETVEPEVPVEAAPVPVPAPTLAEIVAGAERVGNEYHVRPALRVDAAMEQALEKLGYGHERSGAAVTVLYRK